MDGISLFGVMLTVSIAPALIAWMRGHHQALAITILTVIALALWAGVPLWLIVAQGGLLQMSDSLTVALAVLFAAVPWMIALVWSCTAVKREAPHARP